MQAGNRVRGILSWYGRENPGTLSSVARIMNTGWLAGREVASFDRPTPLMPMWQP